MPRKEFQDFLVNLLPYHFAAPKNNKYRSYNEDQIKTI
jgi:hypothetical protein